MGTIDRAHGGTRLGLLIAAGVVLTVAVVALTFGLYDADPPATSPPTGIPTSRPTATTTSRPSSTPTGEESSPPTSRERYEQAARRELEQGLVAYNPPAQARVEEDFEVTVRVQRGTVTVSPSLRTLPGTAPVTIEPLPVGTYMRAELRGSGLDVQPLSDKFQLIDGVTEWAWRVTPQDDGVRTLRLTLVVELNDLPLSSRTFERAIAVDVEKQPPWYERAWGLLDVAGVVTALVIAAILGSAKLARMWWVRREAEEGPGGEDTGTTADAPEAPAHVSAPTDPANGKPTAAANGNTPNP